MLGKCVELLINLPGQSKGNIGEITNYDVWTVKLEMIDGKEIICTWDDVKPLW